MTREIGKSILLTVLVFASIILTWNIWSFQGNYEPTDQKQPVKSVSIDTAYDLKDVVEPDQFILHPDDDHLYGTLDNAFIENIYNSLLQGKWTVTTGGKGTKLSKPSESSYELIFPGPLTVGTLQALFTFKQDKISLPQDLLIDRIDFYRSENNENVMVFKDAMEQPKLYATATNVNMKDMKAQISQNLPEYFTKEIKNKKIYLPVGEVKAEKRKHLYKSEKLSDFVPAVFNDVRNVVPSQGSYSDGYSLLKQVGNVLKFHSPEAEETTVQHDPILQSFTFINNHKGWTDPYIYDDLEVRPTTGETTVDFRLMIDKLSVYSKNDKYEAMISLLWKDGQINEFNRTLVNMLSTKYDWQDVKVQSGKAIIKTIKLAGVKLKSLDDLKIGYSMKMDEQSVTLTPEWFMEQEGKWYAVKTYIQDQHQLKGTPIGGAKQ